MTAQAPSSPGRAAICGVRGVSPPHDRNVATEVTATLKGAVWTTLRATTQVVMRETSVEVDAPEVRSLTVRRTRPQWFEATKLLERLLRRPHLDGLLAMTAVWEIASVHDRTSGPSR